MQVWLLPYRKNKLNYEDIGALPFCLQHDIGFSGKKLYRVVKTGGVVVWIVNDQTKNGSETGTSFKQALYFKEIGFNLHDTMIYEKVNPLPTGKSRYYQAFEYMFVFCKDKIKNVNLICDKPNKWAGHTNWGKNTNRLKNGELQETTDIKPVPDFSPRNNIWKYNNISTI